MRTKTLLVAVAALAVGAITSQAQVYSQNIVGYVNKVIHLGQSLISNPLQGTTNDLEQLLNLQGGEVILLWTGSGYQVYEYQQGYVSNYGTPSDWTDGGGAAIPGTQVNWEGSGLNFVPDPQIAPGQAVFYQTQNATTNWVQNLVIQ
jgi:hypothetical protein